jgi:uncharacterized protein (UPF0147 family)
VGVITISTPFLLFLATERMIAQKGGHIDTSLENPIAGMLIEKAWALSGTDESSLRWRAFKNAFEEAETEFFETSQNHDLANLALSVLGALGDYANTNSAWLSSHSAALEKLSLIGSEPDVETLLNLCIEAARAKHMTMPTRVDLLDVTRYFVAVFRNCLFSDSLYDAFTQQQLSKEHPKMFHDTHQRYLDRMIQQNMYLDFAGVKDGQLLSLESIFIAPQAEVEVQPGARAFKERVRKYQLENERRRVNKGRPEKALHRLPINQVLAKNLNLVVLGDPGAGKTTLLQYIALAFAENDAARIGLPHETRLPIFIRLYDFVIKRAEYPDGTFSLLDYFSQFASEQLQLNLPPGFFADALERGECCVCLDGLVELGAISLRRELVAAIGALVDRYPRNRYIVASRLVGYEDAHLERREFTHLTIQPLSADDIKQFIEKWFTLRVKDSEISQKHIAHLTKAIFEHERIKALAANPLILTIIALDDRLENELPFERVRLYDQCVDMLIEAWDRQPNMKYSLRRRLLEKLAYWMHTQAGIPPVGALEAQLRHILATDPKLQLDEEQIQQTVDEFLGLVKAGGGLLVERSAGIYSFSHLIFQEFLVASDIEKRLAHSSDALWNEIQPHLHETQWREVILLLLGSLNRFEKHNTELIGRIYRSSDLYEPVMHRHLFLVARALADHVEIESGLRNEILDSLLALAASQELAGWDAFAPLGALYEDRRAALGLLALAQDEKAIVGTRLFAAQALGQLGRTDDESRLLLGLAHDEKVHADVRSTAIQALGQLGHASELVLNGLLALAQDENIYAYVRSDAAQALGRLGQNDTNVLNGLLALVRDEKGNERVRRAAAYALGRLKPNDHTVLDALLDLARNEKADRGVRSAAVQALGRVENAGEMVLSGLLALAGNEAVDQGVRCDAADALAQLGWVDHASHVLLALARDEKGSFWVRNDAAGILGRLGRVDEAADVLLRLVRDEDVDDRVRSDAADMLGRLGVVDETVLHSLLALAQDKSMDVRLRSDAAQALGELGEMDEAVSILLSFATDRNIAFWVRSDAAEALGELGRLEEASTVLLELARDDSANSGAQSAMLQALGQLGYPTLGVLQSLLALAQDETLDAGVRSDAAQAIGQLGRADESILSGLLKLVQNEKVDAGVRSDAAQALGELRHADEAVLSGLAGLVRDESVDAWVRIDAAQALAQLGHADNGVLTGLLGIVSNEKRGISMRNAAYHSLKALLGEGK